MVRSDHVLECLLGQALDMVRLTSFLVKKGIIAVLSVEDVQWNMSCRISMSFRMF